MEKARFAYGSKANVSAAIESGAVDAYDFLCLSGENEKPSVGWVDKNGNPIFVECVKYVEVVESLPEVGEEGVIYIFESKGYVWDGEKFVPMTESADLTALQEAVDSKVDAETVQSMIEQYSESAYEIVEF